MTRTYPQVESPTGTGKSLTLLTSTLSWLSAHAKRLDTALEADMRARFAAEDPDDPAWMIDSAVRRHMADLRAGDEARRVRLKAAREKERVRRAKERREKEGGTLGLHRKRAKTGDAKKEIVEMDLLPEDSPSEKTDDGPRLSEEVRALMAKLASEEPKREEETEESVPKVCE